MVDGSSFREPLTNRSIHRGASIPSSIAKPDVILAADCVYFEPAFPLLVNTLDILAGKDTEILFCYKKRRKVGNQLVSPPEPSVDRVPLRPISISSTC
jgi:Lysine methyltransferase